jgi:hypothetical protein
MLDQAVDGEFANAPCTRAESLDKPALTQTAKIAIYQVVSLHLGIGFDPLVLNLYRGGDNWIRATSFNLTDCRVQP